MTDDISILKAALANYKDKTQTLSDRLTEWAFACDPSRISRLIAHTEAYEGALEFYANTENYNYETGALKDMQPRGMKQKLYSVLEFGERARTVLARFQAQGKGDGG